MIVISDTTPIISLIKIGHLDILQQLFGTVRIPKAVFTELTGNILFIEEAKQILSCKFIEQTEVENIFIRFHNSILNLIPKYLGAKTSHPFP